MRLSLKNIPTRVPPTLARILADLILHNRTTQPNRADYAVAQPHLPDAGYYYYCSCPFPLPRPVFAADKPLHVLDAVYATS